MRRLLYLCAIAGLLLASAVQARADLAINLNFDSSFTTNFGGNTAAAEAAVQYAAQQYENLFTNNITINIMVASDNSVFGESSQVFGPNSFQSYSAIRNALINNATLSGNPNQIAFNSTLPVNDPVGSGLDFVTHSAEGKALGLFAANNPGTDGTITFGAANPWNFDTSNRAVAGEYDFVGVVEHEISEVMGRVGTTGDNYGNGQPDFSPIDLARFNAGVRSASNQGANNYFSIDNGATALKYYNNHNADGLDTVDWDSGGIDSHSNQGPDSFNQYSNSGVVNDITAVDIEELNILGYNLQNSPVPEPSSLALVGIGVALLAAYGWRRRKPAAA